MLIAGGEAWLKDRGCGRSWGRFWDSTPAGDMAPWKPKPGDLACDGEETCEVGVAWNCGEGTPYAPSRCEIPNASGFAAMPAGCRWLRAPAGAVLGGMGLALGGAPGAPVFNRSSACTSMPRVGVSEGSEGQGRVGEGAIPFSSKMRSSSEFLYRSIKHSSAALRWLCCKLCRDSSLRLMVVSSWRIYSVLRSRKAAWAWRLRCLRSSEVAYIWGRVRIGRRDCHTV